ncbi:sulfotransferase family 2 domain-containing protein [Sagittula salina]|uniref:Nodulation protein NodH n=1 Tax=Sagittula salina TaxID=2820268 RepID=A0A940MNR5_9RHOB|nr:sulfotransferase family 2 domain-containing protein [Sagittula salina]MBP0483105.1 nodulation protein NodH [Sagittula salina]
MAKFDCFVIFAEMRTGSNFLEANLNAFDGLNCFGEAFNPHFIGYPKSEDILGISQAERDRDPTRLLNQIRKATPGGLGGFRYFHDHDPRVLDSLLTDPKVAKVVLTRNPVDSYVSWKIARATGQWKLTNVKRRKESKAHFDVREFEEHVADLQAFQLLLLNTLQKTAQTAFYIDYDDLQDLGVMNGLARWLGTSEQKDSLNTALKRQNPEPISEKVENFDDMQRALARHDSFNLTRTPNFEPRRGPVVPGYLACATTPLLYMPIRSGPETMVTRWMAALDGISPTDLTGDFTQGALRAWKRERPGHRSFTVIRHPLARAHDCFCTKILSTAKGSFKGIRHTLRRVHALPIPEGEPGDDYSPEAHREAFTAWLRWVRANLSGQTAVRVDGHWATQAQCLQGMADFTLPDMIVRETEAETYLPALAMQVGHPAPADPVPQPNRAPYSLAQIHDGEIESLAREAYQRDYVMFGFDDWA